MPQGRRVRRVVRKIDTWSVLKVSSLFFLTFTMVLILAGVLLWLAGSSIGIVGSVESFMQAIGFEDFTFVGSQLLRGFVAAGLVIVVLGTGSSVLMSIVYNLISDLVGGIQLTVLEEDLRVRPAVAEASESDEIAQRRAARPPASQPAHEIDRQPVPTGQPYATAGDDVPSDPASGPEQAGGYPERSVAGL